MNNQGSVLENDKHEFLLDIEIQRGHIISARQTDLVIVNNKKAESAE